MRGKRGQYVMQWLNVHSVHYFCSILISIIIMLYMIIGREGGRH